MAEPAQKNPYEAVSVKSNLVDCCQAVRAIQDERFTLNQAPMLPLDDCDHRDVCACKYLKWDDRRQDDRRMIDFGIGNQYYHGSEKRTKRRGRRSTD